MNIRNELWRYLDGYRLDYKHFDLLDIVPQDEDFAVTVMRDRREDAVKPWCVQYCGGGHYFKTRGEMDEYCRSRKWRGWD
jgi:hypothetical protein